RADLDGWNLDTLSITPPLDFTGHFDLDIGATAVEGANAASAETHLPLTVVVYPAAATPVVPPSGQEGSVHEDVSLSASGAFNVGTAAFVAGTQNGTYGALSMGADGKWTYTLNNASPAVQALVDNQTETDAFTVRLNNGTSTTVTLHVQGQNDAAVIGAATPGSDRGAVTEDAVLTASGTLAVSDLDAGQAGFVAQTLSDGNYGSLSIDASGHWTYTLNNASAAVQGLKGGESLSRELSVHSLDGTPHTLTITLNGTNDTPLSANDSATTREDTPLVLTPATLLGNDSDPDGDRLSIASVQGASHGSVALVNGNVVFTPTADYNGPASFTYTATDGKGGTSTATVALTVEAVNDAPRVSDGSASGTEDGPLVFNWAQFNATDIDSDPSLLTLRIASLPQDGVLQYNSGNAWVNVSAGQTFGKADVDAGKLRFLPDANESGGPAFGTSGVGNLQGHYARFDYQVGDGQLSSPAAPMTLDIAPVADAPTLSVSTGSRALFSTSWESVSNSDSTSETVPGSTLEGWTLITTPDSLSGGKNVFEVWTSGDSQQNAAGNYVNVVIAAGNGSNALELNNASGTLAQTLGIERTVATQAGKVYDLSLDYAGRPGFSTAYTSIAVLVDGKQIASYASTSPNSGLAWQNLHFSFTGTGGNQTIRLVTNATQFNANGRGALIDDLNLTEYQGAIAGNAANGTLTQIALAAYLVSALRDADGSEALSLTVGNLPSGATLVSASHPSGYSVVDGAVTLDAADLPSARVQLDASYTGPLSLTVAAHATEANGLVADSPTQQLDLQVLPGGVTSATITAGGTAGQTLTGTDNADEIHGQNGNDILYGLKGEDALFGGGGNDTLYGGDGNDKLYGEAGSDTLYGGNGNDQLLGGAGNDLLFGEAGDDRLFGGPGNDQLTGGAGKDTFVWQAGDTGQDTIKDFTPGEDHIDLRDLLQGENDGNILDYLRVNTTTSTLEINSSGNFAHGAAADVTIKLETGGAPVDLSHYGATSSQIVNSLIAGADPTVKIDH
ncbi:VCBS domain-containing protein, partial [Pseudomonas sp. RIT-PI-AD]|uniref:VCBS domain-containing protein n=1 Tax=Pseudomonas sp. RIT-PI-AD TaxID=3035294 RepID=UPI0021D847A0